MFVTFSPDSIHPAAEWEREEESLSHSFSKSNSASVLPACHLSPREGPTPQEGGEWKIPEPPAHNRKTLCLTKRQIQLWSQQGVACLKPPDLFPAFRSWLPISPRQPVSCQEAEPDSHSVQSIRRPFSSFLCAQPPTAQALGQANACSVSLGTGNP